MINFNPKRAKRQLIRGIYVLGIGMQFCFEIAAAQSTITCDYPEPYPKQCAALAASRATLLAARAWKAAEPPRNVVRTKINNEMVALSYELNSGSALIVHVRYNLGKSVLAANTHDAVVGALRVAISNKFGRSLPQHIEIIGHSDLFHEALCDSLTISPDASRCIGALRAQDVKRIFDELLANTSLRRPEVRISYDPDFFMRNTDERLEGTLFEALEVKALVEGLTAALNLPRNTDVDAARRNSSIQATISDNLDDYQKAFAPFRAVVVILN